jgi:NAD(P)H-flavin reductase
MVTRADRQRGVNPHVAVLALQEHQFAALACGPEKMAAAVQFGQHPKRDFIL